MTEQILVLVADDHPVYRKGLRAQFEAGSSMELVEATCAQETVTLAVELKPAVTLIDLRMPKSPGDDATHCGIEAIREIRQCNPGAIIVPLTQWADDAWIFAAIRAGVRGYLLKEVDDTDIVALVVAAACGAAVFSRSIADRMPNLFLGSPASSTVFPELTPQLVEVVLHVARGEGNEAIGRALDLAPKTVSNYVSTIFNRLGVTKRAELVALVRDRLDGEAR